MGQIGFAARMDYTAIGTATNLAARRCAEAKDRQILMSRRVAMAVEDGVEMEEIGDLALKGLARRSLSTTSLPGEQGVSLLTQKSAPNVRVGGAPWGANR